MKTIFCFALLLFMMLIGCSRHSSTPVTPTPIDTIPVAAKTYYNWSQFVMGADLSYVNEVEDFGGIYKDSGVTKDPFIIFKNHGCNAVRVRLWYHPGPTANGKVYSDITDVEKTIQRAKAQGMAVSLDLHYSDTWADPANQATPAAWQGLDIAALSDSVYQYTSRILNELNSKNLTPEMVQIGNETNEGMLFPVGKVVNNNWTNFGILLNSGIKAVRDFSASSSVKPKIILHLAKPENADWWEGNIINSAHVTDFDILGISYYYVWSSLTALDQLTGAISTAKQKYGKAVMVVETDCPWTNQYADNYNNVIAGDVPFPGYGISKDGQYKFMKDLTQAIIRGGGSGIMYWEPAWITSNLQDQYGTGSSYENCTLFDFTGNTLPAMDYMTGKYVF